MTEVAIQLTNIRKSFRFKKNSFDKSNKNNDSKLDEKLIVLDDVSFSISKGEVVGIIGLNGSGKTTLLRIISGIYKPDSGSISVNGILAPLLQIGTGFHEELKAKENIMIYGMLLGFKKQEIESKIEKIIQFSELEEFYDLPLKHYSAGMRVRLAFSIALEMDPEILLIDEVLAVGDIKFQEKSFQSIKSFRTKGKTILFTTHSLAMISQLADRAIILQNGKVEKIGKPNDIINIYKSNTINTS